MGGDPWGLGKFVPAQEVSPNIVGKATKEGSDSASGYQSGNPFDVEEWRHRSLLRQLGDDRQPHRGSEQREA